VRAGGPVRGDVRVIARRWVLDSEVEVEVERGVGQVDGEVDEGVVLAHELSGRLRRARRAALVLERAKAGVLEAVLVVAARHREGRARRRDEHGGVGGAAQLAEDPRAHVGPRDVVARAAAHHVDLVDVKT
jgi:hypothetical protein